MMNYPIVSFGGLAPWDRGMTWRTNVVATDESFLAVDVPFIRDKVLRVYTDMQEDGLIEHYIRAATALGEKWMGQHITPKTLTQTQNGFPSGAIELADWPIRSIASVEYVDADGATQTYGGSPPSYVFSSGGQGSKSRITLGYGETWPSTQSHLDAAVVTFEVGYETPDDVPYAIRQAIAVTVGEFYAHPALSQTDGAAPSLLGMLHFWPRRWSNAL